MSRINGLTTGSEESTPLLGNDRLPSAALPTSGAVFSRPSPFVRLSDELISHITSFLPERERIGFDVASRERMLSPYIAELRAQGAAEATEANLKTVGLYGLKTLIEFTKILKRIRLFYVEMFSSLEGVLFNIRHFSLDDLCYLSGKQTAIDYAESHPAAPLDDLTAHQLELRKLALLLLSGAKNCITMVRVDWQNFSYDELKNLLICAELGGDSTSVNFLLQKIARVDLPVEVVNAIQIHRSDERASYGRKIVFGFFLLLFTAALSIFNFKLAFVIPFLPTFVTLPVIIIGSVFSSYLFLVFIVYISTRLLPLVPPLILFATQNIYHFLGERVFRVLNIFRSAEAIRTKDIFRAEPQLFEAALASRNQQIPLLIEQVASVHRRYGPSETLLICSVWSANVNLLREAYSIVKKKHLYQCLFNGSLDIFRQPPALQVVVAGKNLANMAQDSGNPESLALVRSWGIEPLALPPEEALPTEPLPENSAEREAQQQFEAQRARAIAMSTEVVQERWRRGLGFFPPRTDVGAGAGVGVGATASAAHTATLGDEGGSAAYGHSSAR